MHEQNGRPGQMALKTEGRDVPEIQEMHRWEDQDSVQGMENGVLWGIVTVLITCHINVSSPSDIPLGRKTKQIWR